MTIKNTNFAGEDYTFLGLCDDVKKASKTDKLFMSFSCGADSIAMFLQIFEEETFDVREGVYYYMYYTPDISWVNEYIEYFEDRYKIKIIKVPSPIFLDDIMFGNFQPPMRMKAIETFVGTPKEVKSLGRTKIEGCVKLWAGLPEECLTAVGVKAGDSPMRRNAMRKTQGINYKSKKWYPIWDFENRDAINIIKRHGLKMPYDYDLFGISFENIDYRFSSVIKEKMPEDWKRLCDWFPLLDMNLERVEYYKPEYAVKRKGIMYKKFDTLKPGELNG